MPKAQSNVSNILEEINPWLQGFLRTARVFRAFKSKEGEKVSEQTWGALGLLISNTTGRWELPGVTSSGKDLIKS